MNRLIALLLLPSLAGAQTTWYVDVTGTPPGTGTISDPYTSIQYAIDRPTTVANDTLQVGPGTYVENVHCNGKRVHLIGAGPEVCVIQAAGPGDVVTMDGFPNTKLEGFTITGGQANGLDAALNALGYVEMERCVIAKNDGHGVVWRFGTPTTRIERCTITDNGKQGLRMEVCGTTNLHDTIIWNNGELSTFSAGCGHFVSTFSHNDVQGVGAVPFGPGMFEEDPLFRDPLNGDYRLIPGSPCIDRGTPTNPPDPDGTLPDVGAIPLDQTLLIGESYCTAGISASGCQALVQAHGTPSASASSGFTLSVTNMEGAKDGLFFYGTNGRQANPWGNSGGYVCVIPPRVRGGLLQALGSTAGACDGWFVQDLNARWCATCPRPAHNPGSGAVVQAQMWYRDPQNTSNQTSSMSDAVEFTVAP